MKCFKNATVYVDGEGLKKCSVSFDEKIEKICCCAEEKAEVIEIPENAVVLPGFVDQHIHGAGGSDGMDGTVEDIAIIAKTVAAEGTTSFLVTTMTQSKDNITKAMKAVKAYREANSDEGARVAGIQLEGPFIAASHKGAQPLEYVAAPDVATFDEYNAASGKAIKLVSLAPEVEGAEALIRHLKDEGVVASIGHSAAKYTDVAKAVEAGYAYVQCTDGASSP